MSKNTMLRTNANVRHHTQLGVDLEEGKFAAEFLATNFEKILKLAKSAYDKLDEKLEVALKTAYVDYLKSVGDKYTKSKSFFIRNQAVNLYSYYVPTGIKCGQIIIKSPSYESVLKENNHLVITGTGGSGKTVLMKHLFLDCIKCKKHVPILIELRDLNSEKLRLSEAIENTLDSHGYKVSGQYITRAQKSGHFAFFFDGFDEIDHASRKRVIAEIKKIAIKYPSCPILISSRPDDVFQGIEDFDIYNILPLDLNAATSLITKLPFDEVVKSKFVKDLGDGLFERHQSFLSNPLLLSIMLLTYSENAEIPSKLSLFYNQAYEALFQRHDAYKGGYSRDRLTDLDIQDFSRVFSLFALQTYEKRIFKMPRTACLGYIEKSRDMLGEKFSADDFLVDLLSAACLMLEDGLDIAYSHRSFQEYFVAMHISMASPDVQEKLIDRYWHNMSSDRVMFLLLEMNPELVERVLLVPKLQEFFSEIGVKRVVGVTHTAKYLKKIYKTINVERDTISATLHSGSESLSRLMHLAISYCDTYEFPSKEYFGQHIRMMFDKYGKADERVEYETDQLTYRSPVLSETINSKGAFSVDYLSAAFVAYKTLRSRHENRVQSLDDLLDI